MGLKKLVNELNKLEIEDIAEAYWKAFHAGPDTSSIDEWLLELDFNSELEEELDKRFGEDETEAFFTKV